MHQAYKSAEVLDTKVLKFWIKKKCMSLIAKLDSTGVADLGMLGGR
jgi:hypothetical protein